MAEVELGRALPDLPAGRRSAWVLVRLHSEPLGSVQTSLNDDGLRAQALADLIWSALRRPITERLAAEGVPSPDRLDATGLDVDPARSPYLRRRREILAEAPRISVVICTRDRPQHLQACLERVSRLDYPSYDVIVVDNAPRTHATRRLVTDRFLRQRWRYVLEPHPGAARARNTGAALADGEIVAFLDDDGAPDEHWLAEVARGFAGAPDIGCVTGRVLPARLETRAQDWFERLGGHSKGRGFEPAEFTRDGAQSPLYPRPMFGVGADMAFKAEVLGAIGGFDVALGGGTPARGGEDTLAITQVLLSGYRVAYRPSAIVWHDHRAEVADLARQLRGYGVGLTAYYAALLWHEPSLMVPLLRLLPLAVRDMGADTSRRAVLVRDLPAGLTVGQRGGMFVGPVAYAWSRHVQRKLDTLEAGR
jgi:GT2 family glycosyltransferase